MGREAWALKALKCISDGVIATDREGLVTFMNPAAESLTGLNIKEALGKPLKGSIRFKNGRKVQAINKTQRTRRADGAAILLSEEAVLINAKKQEVPVYHGHSSIRDFDGGIVGEIRVIRRAGQEPENKNSEVRLVKELRRVIEGTIEAVSLVVETRDSYTAGHLRSVARLACSIAEEMDLSESRKNCILVSGALHDIGKIYLPTEILNKPSQLSSSEYASIMNHPQVGYDILKEIDFPWPVAQIVLQHHERMDGSGYPFGLEGFEILLEARILGVADVVEAMSSQRPHRQAQGIDEALEEISEKNILAYDEDVVAACLKLFRENGFVFRLNGR